MAAPEISPFTVDGFSRSLPFKNAGAPTNGLSGSFVNFAAPGDLLIDTTNLNLFANTGTLASPTWTLLGGGASYSPAATSWKGVAPSEAFVMATAAITLVSQTGAQAMFTQTGSATGALTIPIGTYQFESEFSLSAMSSTSGSFGFDPIGAGTATATEMWSSLGIKTTLATAVAAYATENTAANTTIALASTATVGWARVRGILQVTVAGTIIPSVSFTTVAGTATPIIGINSFFKCSPMGSAVAIGNWS